MTPWMMTAINLYLAWIGGFVVAVFVFAVIDHYFKVSRADP